MSGGIEVWTSALATASEQWNDQSEQLRTARSALVTGESSVPLLGSRVSPAATAFLDLWIAQTKQHAHDAAGHAGSLSAAATTYTGTDDAEAARLAALLPWDDRGLRPAP